MEWCMFHRDDAYSVLFRDEKMPVLLHPHPAAKHTLVVAVVYASTMVKYLVCDSKIINRSNNADSVGSPIALRRTVESSPQHPKKLVSRPRACQKTR